MAGFFSRLFGKRPSAAPPAAAPTPAPAPAPAPVRQVTRRIPAALAGVPLAKIELIANAAPPPSPNWLGFGLQYGTVVPPTNPAEFPSFVVVDVETTGLDCVSNEVLEVSALRFENFAPVELFTSLIRPRAFRHVPTVAGDVNKITDADISAAVYFSEISDSLQAFLDSASVIVGHNLPFDVNFLYKSGIRFDDSRLYLDTLTTAKKFMGYGGLFAPPRLTSFRLEDLCQFYGIPLDDAHVSAADCLSTGLVFHRLLEDMAAYEPPKPDYAPEEYIPVKSIVPQVAPDPTSPLYRKTIAFTGELDTGRREAMQMAVDAGMKLMGSVTPKTKYLVRGTYLNPDYVSGKYRKALELNASGTATVQILDEAGFLALLGTGGGNSDG